MPRHELMGRGQQVGIVVAAGVVPTTFTRSLSERTWKDQGLITGLATGTHFLLTVVTQDAIDAAGAAISTVLPFPSEWSLERRQRTATFLLDAAAIPAGIAIVSLLGQDEHMSTRRAVARQAGWRLGLTGLGATLLGVATAGQRQLDARLGSNGRIERIPIAVPVGLAMSLVIERMRQRSTPDDEQTALTRANPLLGLAAGGAVVVGLGGVAVAETRLARVLGSVGSRVLPGSETTWRRMSHLVALGSLGVATHAMWTRAMRQIEAGTSKFDEVLDATAPGEWTGPTVSGDPSSLVDWATMGREGRRHVATIARPEPLTDRPEEIAGKARPDLSISTVMGEPAKATPIAIFVGLESDVTARERVDLALGEMDRTDAWSRSLIMLISPTGTGYVNYVATACAQYLTRGDIATVTLQYSKRPSPLSLGKIGEAKEQNRLLWLTILERVRQMAPADRPQVVIFGESLGAHTSQAPFQGWGTLGPDALGIDRGIWIGTPSSSAWKRELTGPDRVDVDKGLVAIVNDYEQFHELGDDARSRVRYVLISHDNDGVTKFDADLLTRRPVWLGPERPTYEEVDGRSPRGVPASMRWRPVTTFFQMLVDMKNAQIPGAYRSWAHDYRPDLPDFIRDVYGLDCTEAQLEQIKAACQQREEFRESVFS